MTNKNDSIIQNVVSEHDIKEFNFDIYPNPNDGSFTLKVKKSNSAIYQFEIINSEGIVIYHIPQLSVNEIKINKLGLPSGIYYIRLDDSKSVITKKIVIN
ncbi:MAG: T9SS type A sorting domain-containing protein [Thermotogota bacterium]